jgi:C1A family cysteine protease
MIRGSFPSHDAEFDINNEKMEMKQKNLIKKTLGLSLSATAILVSGCLMEQEQQAPAETTAAQVSAANPLHRLGALKEPANLFASKLPAVSTLATAAALPTSFDLSGSLPPPGNQGSQGSCVGWAVGYAAKSALEIKEETWNRTSARHQFSPAYIYNQINFGEDSGSFISDALNLVVNQGVDNLEGFPYKVADYRTKPDAMSTKRASRYKGSSWAGIRNITTDIKNVLATGTPVVIGFAVYPDFDNIGTTNETYNSAAGTYRGRHAATLVGWDDSKQAFKIINSWGTGWGLNGYGWLAYGFIGNSSLDLQCYRMIDKANVKGFSKANHPRTFGDVNNDERKDIVAFANDGVYVSTSNGTTFNPAAIWSRSFGTIQGWTSANTRVLADVNNDKRADVIAFGHGDVLVALSTGTSFSPEAIWHTSFGINDGWDANTVKTVADVNNDNRADIVAFGYGEVYVALSNGSGFGAPQLWTSDFGFNDGWDGKTTRVVADVNNDNRADIVAFGYGEVYVALSNGAGFGGTQLWHTSFGVNDGWDANTVKTVADVNNDNKADIVGFGYGETFVALSSGIGFGGVQNWNSGFGFNDGWDNNTVKIVGDVTGDKKADIIGFGYGDVVFAASSGTSFGGTQTAVSRNYSVNSNEWYLP